MWRSTERRFSAQRFYLQRLFGVLGASIANALHHVVWGGISLVRASVQCLELAAVPMPSRCLVLFNLARLVRSRETCHAKLDGVK